MGPSSDLADELDLVLNEDFQFVCGGNMMVRSQLARYTSHTKHYVGYIPYCFVLYIQIPYYSVFYMQMCRGAAEQSG